MPRPPGRRVKADLGRLEAIQEAQDPEKINEDYRWADRSDLFQTYTYHMHKRLISTYYIIRECYMSVYMVRDISIYMVYT